MACEKQHRYDPQYNNLPIDQGGAGRHRCAGCAYERGYEDGLNRKEKLDLDLDSLYLQISHDLFCIIHYPAIIFFG